MAKIKPSLAISEIRNKVGDIVYSRNRYGAYTRATAIVANPNTSKQAAQRNRFKTCSQAWKSLTNTQRSQWSNIAASLKKVDVFNEQYSSDGFRFYVQINTELLLVGSAVTSSPPALRNIPLFSLLVVTFNAATSSFLFTLSRNNLTSNYAVIIRTSTCLSQGKTWFNNLMNIIKVVSSGASFNYNAYSDYVAAHGAFVSNKRVGYEVYAVDKTTGLRSRSLKGFIDIPNLVVFTVATGGTITTDGNYKVHTFTANGTFTVTQIGTDNTVEYLVVAGGGGGGGWTNAGGGGAGGVLAASGLVVSVAAYAVVVGAGGVGSQFDSYPSKGANSSFNSIIALGGGYGAFYYDSTGIVEPPTSGGSGGGGGTTSASGASGTTGQGRGGGNAVTNAGGGGGGKGGLGQNGVSNTGGAGGVGTSTFITGSSFSIGGGGGGGGVSAGGAGGAGGGGAGRSGSTQGQNGTVNTGGGGGSGGNNANGGNGGSGLVIIRYKFQ